MNQEVPQPITATRSPDCGSDAATDGAISIARPQARGCAWISRVTWSMWVPSRGEPVGACLLERGLGGRAAPRPRWPVARDGGPAQALLRVEAAQERVDVG